MRLLPHFKERFCDRRARALLLLVVFLYIFYNQSGHLKSWTGFSGQSREESLHDESYVDIGWSNHSEETCNIPILEPFSEEVVKYLEKTNKTFYSCDKKYPLLFNSTLEGEIVPTRSLEDYNKIGIQSCCYRVIHRWDKNDYGYKTETECYPLSLEDSTEIPPRHEFIIIKCKNDGKSTQNITDLPFVWKQNQTKTLDMHAFIHVKPEVEERQNLVEMEASRQNRKVNVVVFGLDAASRMNFLRTMPKTYNFLTQKLKAIDMKGYSKVGDNTFPNIVPMLTSLSHREVDRNCGNNRIYDDCPLIWKEYAKQGYRTSYAEDAPEISHFNFERNGFINQPTDYYMRPFALAARVKICHQELISASLCYGPRLSFQVLLDNMKKFVFQMRRLQKPFFQFTWSTSLSHDYLNACELGDKHLLSAFEWLDKSGYMNDTVFILMSDHGLRAGDFRNTLQGQLEDRLPFALLLLPEWMKTGYYSIAYQNLVENSNRLVTTFDLHKTLVDLLHIGIVKNQPIYNRTLALFQQIEEDRTVPRGISLFLPIPKWRTCKMAGIELNYCSCNYLKPVPTDDRKVVEAASIAVEKVNSMLKKYEKCAQLTLNLVKMVHHAGKTSEDFEAYLINFETVPGKGMLEAMVSRTKDSKWGVEGTISRTNLYGNQSHCVHDSVIKLYCYCLE